MAYITRVYYDTEYLGESIPEGSFSVLAERASEIVDILTYGRSARFEKNSLPESVKKAVAAQTEYLATHGGVKAYTGFSKKSTVKESLGSYSYELNGETGFSVGGVPVSPLAVAYLDADGLRCALI